MAQSLFMTLKQLQPQCIIDVIAPTWSVPLLKRMPQVNEAIELPIGHNRIKLLTRYRLGRRLQARQYDKAIITPRTMKSALVPFFAKAKRRVGYRGEHRYGLINDIRPLDKTILYQTVQRYVALAYEEDLSQPPFIPQPVLQVDKANQMRLLKKLGLTLNKPVIGMMPGAEYGPAKQWPVSDYRRLAKQLVEQGNQVWIFGSKKEIALGEQIATVEGIINLCGKTELVDVIDLLALAAHAVTNDSGLMHIAAATGVHVVAIYGSSDPNYTPPLTDNASIVYKAISCSPCFDRKCRFGHYNCLNTIEIKDVLEKIVT